MPRPKHQAVQSQVIASIAHDPKSGTLEVTFHNGKTYTYPAVSPELHQQFLAAPSKTAFFAHHIRSQFTGTLKP